MLNLINLLRSTNEYNSVIPLCIHQNGYNEKWTVPSVDKYLQELHLTLSYTDGEV